jgi:sugar phosphate isomerase/epimerase
MKVEFFCPIWGLVPDYIERIDAPLEPVFAKVKLAGYHGIEMTVPQNQGQKKEIAGLLSSYGLKLIALQWVASAPVIDDYLALYEQHILSAAELKPVYINCHSGKDFYTYEDNCRTIEKALELEEQMGIPVIHEIHRGRFTFHAFSIQPYLLKYPQLRLTADFSHWCNVSESLLIDQEANVASAIKRSVHIHARVGHPQSCQVPDPRDPEYKTALNQHEMWWDRIYETRKAAGAETLTITPEFGPFPYMPVIPFSRKPVSDQWEINFWMKEHLQTRFADR